MFYLLLPSFATAVVFAILWWKQRICVAQERREIELLRRNETEVLRRVLRRAELMHRLVDGIEDGLFILGADMSVIFVNTGAQHFFPPVTEPVGRKLFEFIPHARIVEIASEALASSRRWSEEVTVTSLSPGGIAEDRVYEIVAVPLQCDAVYAAEGALLLILRDETEKYTLEKIRKDFVANASHELRTPLSIIIGYLENLIEGGIGEKHEQERALGLMKKHGDRLAQIVEDLLVISRMESGQDDALRLEEFDLRECANDVIHRLSPVISTKAADVRVVTGAKTDAHLRGDRFYWDQILFNLVQNALKENPAKGLKVEIELRQDSKTLQVQVRDNGVGIPQADLPFVFKRFYRVIRPERASEVKGTGLGLSIVKRAVEAHKGTITLQSKPGVETVFTISMPRGISSRRGAKPASSRAALLS